MLWSAIHIQVIVLLLKQQVLFCVCIHLRIAIAMLLCFIACVPMLSTGVLQVQSSGGATHCAWCGMALLACLDVLYRHGYMPAHPVGKRSNIGCTPEKPYRCANDRCVTQVKYCQHV